MKEKNSSYKKIQLNHFSNLSFSDIVSDNGATTQYVNKVNFNTLSSDDYITNEAYKTLRTNIFFSGKGVKTILITSSQENEGKSTIATELAKSIAESGKKTLLIDADMRKSVMLKKSIRSNEVVGLSELLSGLNTIEEVLFVTQDSNLDVIFSGHFPPNPVELLGNGEFEKYLNLFNEKYDYIIIDSPPLGLVIDAAVIATYCDGAIMVVSNGKISRKNAVAVKEQILKSGCRLLGAVFNQTEKSKLYKKNYYGREYR